MAPLKRVLMEEALSEIIDLSEDRVLIIDIGPADGRGSGAVRTLGRQIKPTRREAFGGVSYSWQKGPWTGGAYWHKFIMRALW